jgi:hypothetical protein
MKKPSLGAAAMLVWLWPAAGLWGQEADASRAVDSASLGSAGSRQLDALHRDASDSPACLDRFAEDYVPQSNVERLLEAARNVTSRSAFIDSALHAGIDEAMGRPKEWDTHLDGFGERLGSSYAEHFIDVAIRDSIAFGLHEDNRYFLSGRHGFRSRLVYVLESSVLARHDDGTRSISVSGIGGAASAAFISRAWQPRSTSSPGDAAVSFAFIIATRTLRNGLREFGPRPIRGLLR